MKDLDGSNLGGPAPSDPGEAISDVSVRAQLDAFFSACHSFLGASVAGAVWQDSAGQLMHRCSRPSIEEPKWDDPLFSYLLSQSGPHLVVNLQEMPEMENSVLHTRALPLRTLVSHPLSIPDVKGRGIVYVGTLVETRFSERWVDRLALLSGWARFILTVFLLSESRARLQAALQVSQQEAHTDSMTRVWNRRGIEQLLTRELARAQREQLHIAVLFVDMDGLKTINDTLGHAAGDAAIQKLADSLLDGLRENDAVGRYGGDEFVCVLVDHTPEPLRAVAQRLNRDLNAQTFEVDGEQHPLAASVGYAITGTGATVDPDTLIARADEAVYAAKQRSDGRAVDFAELGEADESPDVQPDISTDS